MKTFNLPICLLLVISCYSVSLSSQEIKNDRMNDYQPVFFTPQSHDLNFLKSEVFPDKSFYQRKSEWKHIIDTTWGPGDPLNKKQLIFNTFANEVNDKYALFNSLNLDWDSLKNHYLNQITDSTSKGAFAAIMSHFAYELKGNIARDTTVLYRPLKPGVPVLIVGADYKVERFGAVTTILPDSTTLVLRVAPNHPLNLEPGDILLGYEGVPWKKLAKELFNAGLPMIATGSMIKSSDKYHSLMGAGLNWHLFSTIDILKYSTGDTVHLSLEPMAGYHASRMMNIEQIPVPGIPVPVVMPYPEFSDTLVTFGKLDNTNVGYIYLSSHYPAELADNQFLKAVDSLKNTDALIIDLRVSSYGWTFFDKAFNILYNEYHKTITDAYRCNTNTFELCQGGEYNALRIFGSNPDYYDRPIAVLLGPSCSGMGDGTAYRLRFHPMVRFFGASTSGGMSHASEIKNFQGWELSYAT
ncbi:MAG TPA: hypothetical protein VFG54_07975, partial [Prolixibacteraceae bacterium]|nr:hypothetical protein [Prolixibacteraceae bacterium]